MLIPVRWAKEPRPIALAHTRVATRSMQPATRSSGAAGAAVCRSGIPTDTVAGCFGHERPTGRSRITRRLRTSARLLGRRPEFGSRNGAIPPKAAPFTRRQARSDRHRITLCLCVLSCWPVPRRTSFSRSALASRTLLASVVDFSAHAANLAGANAQALPSSAGSRPDRGTT